MELPSTPTSPLETLECHKDQSVSATYQEYHDYGIEIGVPVVDPTLTHKIDLEASQTIPDCALRPNSTEHEKKSRLNSNDVHLLELAQLICFNFPYGFICGTFALWILPLEARRLFPDVKSLVLGFSLVVVGITQLVCPVAGRISDLQRSETRFGKRRPFILWGSISAILATLGMWNSSLQFFQYSYYFFLLVGMASLNVTYAVNCGLVPDVLDEDYQGKASGLVAVHTLLGSACGFILLITISDADFHFVYPMYIIMVAVSCWLTLNTATQLETRLGVLMEKEAAETAACTFTPIVTRKKTNENAKHMMGTERPDHDADHNDDVSESGVLMKETTVSTHESISAPSELFSQYQIIGNAISSSRASQQPPGDSVARVPSFDAYQNAKPPMRRLSLQKTIEMVAHPETPTLAPAPETVITASSPSSHVLHATAASHMHAPPPPPPSTMHHLYHDPHNTETTRRPASGSITMADILGAFMIDTSTSYDFFWVFCGRTMYYVGVSVQVYMLYFLKDVLGSQEGDAQFQLGCIALIAQFCAASIAYPIGKYTDETTGAKKPLIYLACACMSAVYMGFLVSPIFGKHAFLFVLATSALYGAGNGCFLAVDYALALATIPDKENTAQALGVWGVSAFIGSAVGPMMWGILIEAFGRDPVTSHYAYGGYVAMLLGGISATCGAGVIIKLIKGVK